MQGERVLAYGQWGARCGGCVARRSSGSQQRADGGGYAGSERQQSVRDYFVGRPMEYQELRGIAAPLVDLQRGCNTGDSADADRGALYRRCPKPERTDVVGYMRP